MRKENFHLSLKFYSCRHTTREIMEAVPELGMVIDLTNTPNRTRYYQPNNWMSNGIAYQWIKCEGERDNSVLLKSNIHHWE
jgi:hypothetical protein